MSSYDNTQCQLILYEILYSNHKATNDDLMRRLSASKISIQRDIEDLAEAYLIKLSSWKRYLMHPIAIKRSIIERNGALKCFLMCQSTQEYLHQIRKEF